MAGLVDVLDGAAVGKRVKEATVLVSAAV